MRGDPEAVARWIAPAQPKFAFEILRQPDFGFNIAEITDETREVLLNFAKVKTGEAMPSKRAAAYRDFGTFGLDNRFGIGVGRAGLPEFDWVNIPSGELIYSNNDKDQYPHYVKPSDSQVLRLPAFRIGRYPVTFAQFQAFIDAKDGFHAPHWWDGFADDKYRQWNQSSPGGQAFKFNNHPRENVSWYDAMAFCRWLSYKLGGEYALNAVDQWIVRLPTEYEWEKAARGTDGRIYPYGNEFDRAEGNTRESGINQTSAVGLFPDGESPYGVLDMSGNVWEWCLKDHKKITHDAHAESSRNDARQVLCGGSWINPQGDARVVIRHNYPPDGRVPSFGFRVVSVIPPSVEP